MCSTARLQGCLCPFEETTSGAHCMVCLLVFGHTPVRRYGTLPVISHQYEWTAHVPPQAWIAGYTHVVTFALAVGHLDGGPWRWQALPGQWASTLQLSVSTGRNGLIPDMLYHNHGFGSGWVGFKDFRPAGQSALEAKLQYLNKKMPEYQKEYQIYVCICMFIVE